MKILANHYRRMRQRYPDEQLLILFDIDGTILDMRYMVTHVLKSFDTFFGSYIFQHIQPDDVTVHENRIEEFLAGFPLSGAEQKMVADWYYRHQWGYEAILESHRPFKGVLEIIRWFQLQPNTQVGLNTGRPESLRFVTLFSLNELGKEFRIRFRNDLLYMNPKRWKTNVGQGKIEGIEYFRKKGFRILAVVDNEPSNLGAIAKNPANRGILLLHADTLFETKRSAVLTASVSGKSYDMEAFVNLSQLPQHIQFVWQGMDSRNRIREFLNSNIHWAQFNVVLDIIRRKIMIYDPVAEKGFPDDEIEKITLSDCLRWMKSLGRGVKLNLKDPFILDPLIDTVREMGMDDSELWFCSNLEYLKEDGFRKLQRVFPGAIIQCSVDFLVPLMAVSTPKARDIVRILKDWGINRYSLDARLPAKRKILDFMDDVGLDVNIDHVDNLESFLKTILLQPRSVSLDFYLCALLDRNSDFGSLKGKFSQLSPHKPSPGEISRAAFPN